VIVVGMNDLGRRVARLLHEKGETVLAIDTDIRKMSGLACHTLVGDIDYAATLEEAGLDGARMAISALRIENVNKLFVFRCRDAGVPVAVYAADRPMREQLREVGASYLVEARQASGDRLLSGARAPPRGRADDHGWAHPRRGCHGVGHRYAHAGSDERSRHCRGCRSAGVSVPVDGAVVRDGLLISATFLVFAVGAEIERKPLRPYRWVALGPRIDDAHRVTAAVGALLWAMMDLNGWTAIYWVTALSASSTLLVFDLLRSREQLFEPTGRVVSATALMQDLIVILTLAVFVALAPTTPHPGGILAGVAGLAVAGWLVSRWVAPFVERVKLDEEERLLFILLVLFGFAAVARRTGGALVTGAYFAGLAISRFPVGDMARGYLKSFSDFFTTIFYVTLGLLITVPSSRQVMTEIVFVTVIVFVRPLFLLPLMRRSGLTVHSSIEAVTLLAQAGELAVIVAIVGVELGHLGEATLGAVVAVVAVTTSIVPWLSSDRVTWRLTRGYPFGRKVVFDKAPTDHVLLLGCGETGSRVLAALCQTSSPVVVIEGDPAVVQALAQKGVFALRGDAADPEVLREAQADQATVILSTMRRAQDNVRLLANVRGPAVFVRVFSEQEANQIRELGGHPIVEAEVAAQALLGWHAAVVSGSIRTNSPRGRM
jgi:Kef-type K+ transport system membrane component KefB/Trk K+ transport system NAD-binding subunit